jgi:hypothetical protein
MTSDRSLTLCDATDGVFSVYLPAAADSLGRVLNFKKIDSSVNAVTIDANGAETIDDALTFVLASQYDCVTITSDGTEWWVI